MGVDKETEKRFSDSKSTHGIPCGLKTGRQISTGGPSPGWIQRQHVNKQQAQLPKRGLRGGWDRAAICNQVGLVKTQDKRRLPYTEPDHCKEKEKAAMKSQTEANRFV